MHQIRVHLAHIGHPLFVDPVYGRRAEFFLSEWKGRKYKTGKFSEGERPLIKLVDTSCLEARFNPSCDREKKCILEADIPKDLRALLKQGKIKE